MDMVREFLAHSKKPPVLIVTGPTASGKTAYAITLAESLSHLQPEIINIDSRQIYRGLAIGSAAPTAAEQARVKHHLVGTHAPDDIVTAFSYRALVTEHIHAIHQRNHLPILVGGHMLVLMALVAGFASPGKADSTLRAHLTHRYATEGGNALHAELRAQSPAAAERIHPNNPHHLIRALERAGDIGTQHTTPYSFLLLARRIERSVLHAHIEKRVHDMLAAGLIAEARALFAHYPPDIPALRSHGYQELLPYFQGTLPLETAVQTVIHHTRQYAKRQETWLRNARWRDHIQWI